MICKNCGYQLADNSTFCVNCGAAVDTQPQYAQQPQYVVQQQFVYEPPLSREYTEYIDRAGSAMSRSITSLILTLVLPFAGWLVGFIMSLTVKGTLGKLRRNEINENELYTQKSREDYAAAKRKAKTAKIISTINLLLILLPVFIGIFLGILAATGILYEIY